MSKTAGQTTTSSTTGPAAFQKPYLEGLFQEAKGLYGGEGPQYYPGTTVAPFNPTQTAGMSSVTGAAPTASSVATNFTLPALQQALTATDVGNNPFVAGSAKAAVQPLYENLTQQVLPSLRQGAVASGNRGSSREGIAAGQAVGQTAEAAGNATANIYGNAYNSGLNAMLSGINQTPTVQSSLFAPGQTVANVGAQQQQQTQAEINAAKEKFAYEQNLPYEMLSDYAGLISTPYGGSAESTVTGTPPDKASQILSLILGGAGTAGGVLDLLKRLGINIP